MGECVVFRIANDQKSARLGITLKARGTSLERNRTKRAIRESFRLARGALGAFDYNVVIPSEKKMGFPYPAVLGLHLKTGWNGIIAGTLLPSIQKPRSGR